MRIILTPEGSTTEERWKTETPYLADLIASKIEITADTVLIDYGCGIGRMAKELIARRGCRVIGVDISPSMRALAVIYVASDRFFSCASAMLDAIVERGFSCDAEISVWVLQHCAVPADDIARLRRAMKPKGDLFIVNNDTRAVPIAEQGWTDDGVDVKAMLRQNFTPREDGRLAREMTSASLAQHTFWASFRQRR